MRVAVGSTNPVKREATAAAFETLPGVSITTEAVDSGVSDQPFGHEETLEGAENRAERALAAGSYDLGVGIEGGVAEFDGVPGLYLVMWAAVTDGDATGRGAGPSIRLPEHIAERIREGAELGPLIDSEFGLEKSKEKQGAAGVLTGNTVDRKNALAVAVSGALGPFITSEYDL